MADDVHVDLADLPVIKTRIEAVHSRYKEVCDEVKNRRNNSSEFWSGRDANEINPTLDEVLRAFDDYEETYQRFMNSFDAFQQTYSNENNNLLSSINKYRDNSCN